MTASGRGTLALGLALVLVLAFVAGCARARTTAVPPTPKPEMAILYERNRQIWLNETDDDQMDHASLVWKAAWSAIPRASAEITRTEFDTIARTGAMAASYYRSSVDVPSAKGARGLAVVFANGDAPHVKRGDLVIQRSGPRYYVVGSVPAEDLGVVEDSTYRRMGLR